MVDDLCSAPKKVCFDRARPPVRKGIVHSNQTNRHLSSSTAKNQYPTDPTMAEDDDDDDFEDLFSFSAESPGVSGGISKLSAFPGLGIATASA